VNEQEAEEILRATEYWHYPFELPWQQVAPTRASLERHHLRRQHFFEPLLDFYGGSLAGKTILDLGCCQGFWSFEAAKVGAVSCLGIDSSKLFIREARALSTILQIGGCEFLRAHVEEASCWEHLSPRDVTLFLGLFYHLADPLFVLRQAMRCTSQTIVIDTNVTGDKGSSLTIVPRDAFEPTTRNSQVKTKIRVVPSRAALRDLLADGGFRRIEFLKPHSRMLREYRKGERVSVIAHR
jgi:tRNA (mo5U34)-methyltransferase